MGSVAFEKHYRVKELAGRWGLSAKTVTRLFADEAGVIRVANDLSAKRKYATLSIPESVASRVHERLSAPGAEQIRNRTPSVRIIRLADLEAPAAQSESAAIKLRGPSKRQGGKERWSESS